MLSSMDFTSFESSCRLRSQICGYDFFMKIKLNESFISSALSSIIFLLAQDFLFHSFLLVPIQHFAIQCYGYFKGYYCKVPLPFYISSMNGQKISISMPFSKTRYNKHKLKKQRLWRLIWIPPNKRLWIAYSV